MTIEFENECTIKELKLQSEMYAKLSKKFYNKFLAEFSVQEKERAKSCSDGIATTMLKCYAKEYFSRLLFADKQYFMKYKPSTKLLLSIFDCTVFCQDEPYFNKYFASEWYRINYESLVDDYFCTKDLVKSVAK